MKTNVYVDGFNLYYGSLKGTSYRWLDLSQLCRVTLKGHDIDRIRYFTARVQSRPDNPQQMQRQQVYIRALNTIPILSVHYGYFLSKKERMLLANPSPGGPRTVEVVRTEEKGSDVNIGAYLLRDGFRGEYEAAVIISNDSDLVEPIRIIRNELGLEVGVLNPHKNISWALKQAATFYRELRKGPLGVSQFPPTLINSRGNKITKPVDW